jgi:hypothetical protein
MPFLAVGFMIDASRPKEDETMSHLKSLSFTAVPKGAGNPTAPRRAKLVARLEEQRALALDPSYAPATKRWVKGADGTKQLVEQSRRIRPWWRAGADGSLVLTVRYGFKTIEFEKGKAGVAVPSKDKLVGVIDTMIAAVRAGELDEVLAQQSKARGVPKARKAA